MAGFSLSVSSCGRCNRASLTSVLHLSLPDWRTGALLGPGVYVICWRNAWHIPSRRRAQAAERKLSSVDYRREDDADSNVALTVRHAQAGARQLDLVCAPRDHFKVGTEAQTIQLLAREPFGALSVRQARLRRPCKPC